jgi:hypothetical protein
MFLRILILYNTIQWTDKKVARLYINEYTSPARDWNC